MPASAPLPPPLCEAGPLQASPPCRLRQQGVWGWGELQGAACLATPPSRAVTSAPPRVPLHLGAAGVNGLGGCEHPEPDQCVSQQPLCLGEAREVFLFPSLGPGAAAPCGSRRGSSLLSL